MQAPTAPFPYTFADKPRRMTVKQWHWMRKHRPAELIALIEDSHRPVDEGQS